MKKNWNLKGFGVKYILVLVFALLLFVPSVDAKTYSKKECKQYARNLVINKYHWSIKDYKNLVKLWNRESGWNVKAYNRRINACGITQAAPCSKMRSAGADYRTNCKTQIKWGLKYIKRRYKTPTKAWKHFKKYNGY